MINIMVVDDDMNIRSALSRELRFHGFNIIPAETGQKALNKLENQPIDLVLVDIRMPIMGGLEFISKVVVEHPQIQIIILSGTITKEVIASIAPYRDNILDVIAKPWNQDSLLELIKAATS
ncbi:MAG: response regulator [Spirochaetia bacterium]|jgi:DNA-binding NtrC family response regulator|nr:response regulator [Spirochaetia bacterium]